ncbi:MAG: V-type ATP synthase subunit A [Christensenellaceae bacterium]|jgi:V/A-type H+-transporting ATPase subunit A|nr:V-type ATP synthase subunit A [Christensenellaceae bacterium]
MENAGEIVKISGPLIIARNMANAKMFDVVHVGREKLIGEIIELRDDRASIQVYEETGGLRAGEPVVTTGAPLSMELAPGIMSGIFDGIGRPLEIINKISGDRISRGISIPSLDRNKKWDFKALKKNGDLVAIGDILGEVKETEVITHKILSTFSGKITGIKSGAFTIAETIAEIDGNPVCMLVKWPVRKGRPYKMKLSTNIPLITGQRVIDTLFPIAKGGVGAIPGPFGSGKTVVQHQIAKWADAQVIVYIGCGERGNEMTDVLNEFPKLIDMRTKKPLMQRTILIANTSDMPVAAREASIYTGITIAEYFRDMGYDVAIMADSTSRWAEALREMSGRLEEIPAEEGYPAYLSSRVSEFYERAGRVAVLGSEKRTGSITAIGAVSPPGGDLSEPVSQATLRIVKVFWGLSASLAYRRHFPAIDWLISYSLYADKTDEWYKNNLNGAWADLRKEAMKVLQVASNLEEIVRLVGEDSLSDADKLILSAANSIKEDYLMQFAFNEIDTFTSPQKQFKMLNAIITHYFVSKDLIKRNVPFQNTILPSIKYEISQMKYLKEDNIGKIDDLILKIKQMSGVSHE